jgi:hypothetical protein
MKLSIATPTIALSFLATTTVVQASTYTCPNYDDQAVIFVIAKSPDPEGLEEAAEKFEDLFGGIGDNGNAIGVQEDGYRTSKCHPSGVSLLCCGGWATNNTHKHQTPTNAHNNNNGLLRLILSYCFLPSFFYYYYSSQLGRRGSSLCHASGLFPHQRASWIGNGPRQRFGVPNLFAQQ